MDGSVVQLFSASAYTSSPLQTELLAIRLAIHRALFHNFTVVYLFTDYLNAVMQLAGRSEWMPLLGQIFVAQPQTRNFAILVLQDFQGHK